MRALATLGILAWLCIVLVVFGKPATPSPPPLAPIPPTVTVTVTHFPTASEQPCPEGVQRIDPGPEGDPETCENGHWHEGPPQYVPPRGGPGECGYPSSDECSTPTLEPWTPPPGGPVVLH